MAPKYSEYINVRLADRDMKRLSDLSVETDTPRAALVRKALRGWMDVEEKTLFQKRNSPAT